VPHEQPDTGVYLPFQEACTCDKVRVGACLFALEQPNDAYFCAVSAEACDVDSTFVEWYEMEESTECYLCHGDRQSGTVQQQSVRVLGRGSGHWSPAQQQSVRLFATRQYELVVSKSSSGSNGTAGIAFLLVSACVVGLIAAGVIVVGRRCRKPKTNETAAVNGTNDDLELNVDHAAGAMENSKGSLT